MAAPDGAQWAMFSGSRKTTAAAGGGVLSGADFAIAAHRMSRETFPTPGQALTSMALAWRARGGIKFLLCSDPGVKCVYVALR
jgi:hypothetical protein